MTPPDHRADQEHLHRNHDRIVGHDSMEIGSYHVKQRRNGLNQIVHESSVPEFICTGNPTLTIGTHTTASAGGFNVFYWPAFD
jgi:hypothetical protein